MKVTLTSKTKKTTVTETRRLKVGPYRVVETWINNKLERQEWRVNGKLKERFQNVAFDYKLMYFHYYPDISFLDSDEVITDDIWNANLPELITDWDKFKGFDHVLANHLAVDGNLYCITKKTPIAFWRHSSNWIRQIGDSQFDLPEMKSWLTKQSWARNVEIVYAPYWEQDNNKLLDFEYKLPSTKHLARKLEAKYPREYFG